MSIREVKKRSGPVYMTCVCCGVTQVEIGKRSAEWIPFGSGHVCAKDACRISAGLPKHVPPDDKR